MTRAQVRRLVVFLTALAVMGGAAAAVSAASKDMITLSAGQAVAFQGSNVEVADASGSSMFAERGCFTGEPAPGTTVVVGGVEYDSAGNIVSLDATLATVPANGASAVVTKVFPEGATPGPLPDFHSLAQPSQTLPMLNLPLQQLQGQMPLAGGFVQFAGLNSGLGFNEPFVVAFTVDATDRLRLNGFEFTMSSTHGEVAQQGPGAQPYQFSQPVSYNCDNVKTAHGLVTGTYRFFSQEQRLRRAILATAAKAVFVRWWTALGTEEKWLKEVETDLKTDNYMPALKLGPSIINEQKKLDLAAAKLAPQIKSPTTKSKFSQLERQRDASVNGALAAIKQAITPTT